MTWPGRPKATADSPLTITPEEQAAIARAFDEPSSIFSALSTLRTRRIGLGYQSETGEEEIFDWSSRQPVKQRQGPLSYSSQHPAVPLTEVEEALVAWAGIGPNGAVAADIPTEGDLSSLLYWAGRTVPGSSNDHAVQLVVVNDEGTWLYAPGPERNAPIEIKSPDDYWKVLHWYRNCRTKLSDARPDVGWGTAPPGTHNVNTMGALQYNSNRPGSTWFLPVGDVGLEWVNLLLSSYQFGGFYLQDPDDDKPAGCDAWIKPGFLEVGFPIPTFDELALLLHASEVACCVQNMRLACEALGLGAWAMGGYSDDLVLGAYPEVAVGLGFQFVERELDRNPSRTTSCIGLPEVFEACATPSPWLPTAEDLVHRVVDLRYRRGAHLSREDNWSTQSGGPFREEALEAVLEHPRTHIPDWVVEATIDTVRYVAEKYGVAPGLVSPVRAKFSCQVHHVDLDYYRRFHTEYDNEPYLVTSQIAEHFRNWHAGEADPTERSG